MTDNQEDLKKRYEKLKAKFDSQLNREEDLENLQKEYDKYMRKKQVENAIELLTFLESLKRNTSND